MKRPHDFVTPPGSKFDELLQGSGTTLVAAQFTERICVGLDIDPAYHAGLGEARSDKSASQKVRTWSAAQKKAAAE